MIGIQVDETVPLRMKLAVEVSLQPSNSLPPNRSTSQTDVIFAGLDPKNEKCSFWAGRAYGRCMTFATGNDWQ